MSDAGGNQGGLSCLLLNGVPGSPTNSKGPTCRRLSLSLLSPPLVRLLQEELRELREQPIDPQAEQEMIESIAEVYYSCDSFDMVKHELEVSGGLLRPTLTHFLGLFFFFSSSHTFLQGTI